MRLLPLFQINPSLLSFDHFQFISVVAIVCGVQLFLYSRLVIFIYLNLSGSHLVFFLLASLTADNPQNTTKMPNEACGQPNNCLSDVAAVSTAEPAPMTPKNLAPLPLGDLEIRGYRKSISIDEVKKARNAFEAKLQRLAQGYKSERVSPTD